VCVEQGCQFSACALEIFFLLHELQQLFHLLGQKIFRGVKAVREHFPDTAFLIEPQFQFPVFDIPACADQLRMILIPFVLVQNKDGIHRTADTGGAGQTVDGISVTHLSQMVYQQNGDPQSIRDPLQLLQFLVVTTVGRFAIAGSHHLEGIDDNQYCVRMFFHELYDLLFQILSQCACGIGKEYIGRCFIRDASQPLLDAEVGIFQAEI